MKENFKKTFEEENHGSLISQNWLVRKKAFDEVTSTTITTNYIDLYHNDRGPSCIQTFEEDGRQFMINYHLYGKVYYVSYYKRPSVSPIFDDLLGWQRDVFLRSKRTPYFTD